jgi:type II secretory ATPase GspE/PulE/Tfp pilus assembly ATPase PilB-like protein
MLSDDVRDQLGKMRREAEERDAQRRGQAAHAPYLEPARISVNLEALSLLDEKSATEGHCAVIAAADKKIAVVAYDPMSPATRKVLEDLTKRGFKPAIYVISLSSLQYVLSYYRFAAKKHESITGSVRVAEQKLKTIDAVKASIATLNNPGSISPLMQTILVGAVENRASDIHFEPQHERLRLRYRIDGELQDIFTDFQKGMARPIVSRIKLLAGLKLNVRDETQDGRFTIDLPDRTDIEVRVAIAPSEFGEVVVMRLLDPEAIEVTLDKLGLRSDDLAIIEEQLKKPNGMALNTGPTGSGKTTTLYAFLKRRLDPAIKIITIEDPIEYHLEGIEQTQVDEAAGYTFAGGLRSLMRQDPDVILVGEIRDKETAEIAVQAALTGHLVFSTVHANESAGGIARLLDLGAKPNSIAPALNLLIAQRLVRKLCDACKKEKALENKELGKLEEYIKNLPQRVNKEIYKDIKMFEPTGCDACNGSGYKGRIAVFELLVVNDEIRELIGKDAGQIEIKRAVAKTDFVSMQQDGVLKAVSGITSLAEVEEVTGKVEELTEK